MSAPARTMAPAAKTSFSPVPAGTLQRCGARPCDCKHDEGPKLMRRSLGHSRLETVPSVVEDVLRSPARSLDPTTREFFEPRFGHDFGKVSVHTDAQAAASAEAVDALAYTVGSDVVFGAGRYRPATAEGRSLIAHELTHVVQQASGAPRLAKAPPEAKPAEEEDDELYKPLASTDELRARLLPPARDRLLEALDRFDAITFLNRLRALTQGERQFLEADPTFMKKLGERLSGLALWTVRLILRFGAGGEMGRARAPAGKPRPPSSSGARPARVQELYNAVFMRDFRRITDLIRGFPDLGVESSVPGTRDMLDHELRGTRQHDAILALLAEKATSVVTVVGGPGGGHYEQKAGEPYKFVKFGGSDSYELMRTGTELRVVVRMRLVRDDATGTPYHLEDATMKSWRDSIDKTWNNRFIATNGTDRLRIIFVPVFTQDLTGADIRIKESKGCSAATYFGARADASNWCADFKGWQVAHEFGHLVGDPDEYALAGSIAEAKAAGLSDDMAKRQSVEGITGKAEPAKVGGHDIKGTIMGEAGVEVAAKRQAGPILAEFNAHLKPGEAPYHIE